MVDWLLGWTGLEQDSVHNKQHGRQTRIPPYGTDIRHLRYGDMIVRF